MPVVTCSRPVEADIQNIWRVFLDKIENPSRYMAHVQDARFLEDTPDYVVREIITENMTILERITLDERMGEVRFTLLEHPLFTGTVVHSIHPNPDDSGLPAVTITMDWTPKNPEAALVEKVAADDIKQNIEEATLYIKRMAEQLERQHHLEA